jgi:hypothetical protein
MGRTFYETHAFVNIFYIVVRFEVMLDDGTLALVILECHGDRRLTLCDFFTIFTLTNHKKIQIVMIRITIIKKTASKETLRLTSIEELTEQIHPETA